MVLNIPRAEKSKLFCQMKQSLHYPEFFKTGHRGVSSLENLGMGKSQRRTRVKILRNSPPRFFEKNLKF